jgi:2-amino-4-hydroxy-6-hydroxymethyldihydropteridine diphosphokinase
VARILLGLGGNVDDPLRNLCLAVTMLAPHVRVTDLSSLYDSAPVGFLDQPRFLNVVVSGETALTPDQLLEFVKKIERQIGRKQARRNGPRNIDIDILLYDGISMHTHNLTLPHPHMHTRRFVLEPLAELQPDLTLPGFATTVNELLARLLHQDVKRLQKDWCPAWQRESPR